MSDPFLDYMEWRDEHNCADDLQEEDSWEDEAKTMINVGGKCQYCGGPSPDSYTCSACTKGWPFDNCRCENNGDYCDACDAWIETRKRIEGRKRLAFEIAKGLNTGKEL